MPPGTTLKPPTPLQPSTSSQSQSSTQAPPTPTGLRAQINHLRPRHAYFRAEVYVAQINSIPYVNGDFAVKWRFRNVQMPRVGLLGRIKRGKSMGELADRTQGGKEGDEGEGEGRRDSTSTGAESFMEGDREMGVLPRPSTSTSTSTSISTGHLTTSSTSTSSSIPTTSDGFLSVPSSLSSLSQQRQVIAPSIQTTRSTSSSSASSHNHSFYNTPLASASRATISSSAPSTPFPSLPPTYVPTPAKGQSAFLPLKEHSVSWNLSLDTVLKMDIERDTHNLLESPFKLVVVQKEEEDGPRVQNPRLGAVYLNLAEYVDKGRVERRYLLRESRTNATLKLSILLTPLSSPQHPTPTYISPPLPKGEILTGIASFLESDAYKRHQRPRELELWGPYRDQEELEIDLMGGVRSKHLLQQDDDDDEEDEESEYDSCEEGEDPEDPEEDGVEEEEKTYAFDPARLPIAYGIKTTETLIEALFNPEVVYDKRDECPFTTFVDPVQFPPKPKPELKKRGKGGKKGSEHSSSESSQSHGSDKKDGGKEGGGVKAWFRRIGASSTRPGTPTSETFALPFDEPKSSDSINNRKHHAHQGSGSSIAHGMSFVLAPGLAPSSSGVHLGRPGTPGGVKRPATPRMDTGGRGRMGVTQAVRVV